MSDLSDSPVVTVDLCPVCEPDYDYKALINLRNCHRHEVSMAGEVDIVWGDSYHIPSDAGGEPNRVFCDFLHRPPAK